MPIKPWLNRFGTLYVEPAVDRQATAMRLDRWFELERLQATNDEDLTAGDKVRKYLGLEIAMREAMRGPVN